MRVAVVNQPLDGILPPGQNSIGIWTYETTRRLADRCDVTVHGKYLREVRDRGVARTSVHDGVRYRFVPGAPNRAWERVERAVEERLPATWPIFARPWYFAEYAAQVALELRRGRPDVVHVHNFLGFLPALRRAHPGAAIALHMSCEWLTQLDPRRVSRRLDLVDAVYGVSEHITGLVREAFPAHAGRCSTIHNGVDPAAFERGPSPEAAGRRGPSVLFVGRVSPEKGVHDLIDAMALVLERHPDAVLDVVGAIGSLPESFIVSVSDDPLVRDLSRFYADDGRTYLDQLLARIPAGRESQITFHGPMTYDEVLDRYARADVLVNPSYSESFGISPVEAMASGVPAVVTDVGGMKETVVDGETGRRVAPGDVAALAGAIDELLADPALRRELGERGRARVVERFSWASVADLTVARWGELT